MTVPTGLKTNANKGSHGLDFIQLKEAQSKSLQISACEFLEEIEELEKQKLLEAAEKIKLFS